MQLIRLDHNPDPISTAKKPCSDGARLSLVGEKPPYGRFLASNLLQTNCNL